MKIEDKLVASVINGLKALYGQEVPEKMVQLQKTKKEFEGHLTLVVFPFLKMSRKGPEQTAQEIGEYLKAVSYTHLDVYKRQKLCFFQVSGFERVGVGNDKSLRFTEFDLCFQCGGVHRY